VAVVARHPLTDHSLLFLLCRDSGLFAERQQSLPSFNEFFPHFFHAFTDCTANNQERESSSTPSGETIGEEVFRDFAVFKRLRSERQTL